MRCCSVGSGRENVKTIRCRSSCSPLGSPASVGAGSQPSCQTFSPSHLHRPFSEEFLGVLYYCSLGIPVCFSSTSFADFETKF